MYHDVYSALNYAAHTEVRLICKFLHPPGRAFTPNAKTRQSEI